jgi:hypothetical protein
MYATIKVKMDNDAFVDDPTRELADILHALSERLRGASPDESYPLRDANGNKVGECIIRGRR